MAREVLSLPEFNEAREDELFRGFFGAPIGVIATLWNLLMKQIPTDSGCHPKHLLWTLVFLKVNSTTAVHCRIVGWPYF